MPLTYIKDRMTATYMMLKPFSKLFLVPFVNITYPLLHQHFPVLPAWQSIDIIVTNISGVVNTCVEIINRQQVKDIYTYSKYGSTSSLLLSTYQTSCLNVVIDVLYPIPANKMNTMHENIGVTICWPIKFRKFVDIIVHVRRTKCQDFTLYVSSSN